MAGLQPTILRPVTPSELFQYLIANTTYPTTVVIAWPRDQFTSALVEDIRRQESHLADGNDEPSHPLLRATLLQTAISRHINIVFAPTVTHLRAHLSTFSAFKSGIPAPPRSDSLREPPALIVYGLLDIHRDGMEWSAQGISLSTAAFVESAFRNKFRAVVVEARRSSDQEELEQSLKENVPVLTGTPLKEDGSWSGPIVPLSRVLGSWFKIDARTDE
ncbi:hypothetical protein J3459_002578 [Metarhizium acridum]|uniref:Uncharacterized protein n=1 Tax=Metarhizium acridum (strain CQMa 102) TaxID=655827 RepID=E9DV44_METAQ|nr:uncharacterized protein MAC_01434 [Metarhizium acridum CQMa 102]EFY92468.1 hypothetical protein MAC_01434 [Metarhizium acridum CQMa 102]KAG8428624.1 hypothetical protein J3459_002578 [Metarhizium acridum]